MGYKVKRFSVLLDKMFGTTDRDSGFWRKKIEELKRVNPNHPKIKKFEQQLQYALEEEAKTDPKKAEEAARRRAQGHSSGFNTRNTYNAAEEAKAYEEGMRANWRKARSTFNSDMRKKSNTSFNKMAKTTAKIDAVGLAAIPTALGAYAVYDARKKKKAWENKQKKFSSETKEDKKKRLKNSGVLLGTSAALGSGVGALSTFDVGEKIKNKVWNQNYAEKCGKLNFLGENSNVLPLGVQKEVLQDIENTTEAGKRYVKRANKVIKKAAVKNAGKGALIGTAIGLPLAYAGNVNNKIQNEKKNKKKTKKFSKVLMPGFKLVPVKDLSDKQLENMAKNDDPKRTKIAKKNQKKIDTMLGTVSGLTGMEAGRVASKAQGKKIAPGMTKGAIIGTAAGIGASEVMGYYGRKHHKKTAEEARAELKKRGN